MPRVIRQSATFKASPKDVYKVLMTSRLHSKVTGGKAVISTKVGGKWSAHDGYCHGVNLELKPGKKIVQSWRVSYWPAHHYSVVTFVLTPVKGGTRLRFSHREVPDAQHESIKQGWIDFYWTPMRAFFSAQGRA